MQRASAPLAWRYATPAIVLHWLVAALIVFMASLGWWMMTVEHEPEGPGLFDLHKSIGLILLALVALRVLWRLGHRPEPLPTGVPRWQVVLSRVTQAVLYLLMIAVPLAGLLGAIYSRTGLTFFGTHVPRWVTADRPTAKQFFELHETLVWVLVACVALHVVGGLKHLLVDRDQVFGRMWLGRR
ncbi:cytochrome b [Ramlibacter alkalitolerans]|uniref:cytochrome b n=1 Tax=Ramlibacter alkalitolerans TaxID=2039631 RepID=UPI001F381E70|nr:cytochrome b [Ramlibacter alkalitolerans]